MYGGLDKAKSAIGGAPVGAAIGGALGYMVAKHFGYHNTLMVVSFTIVGALIGSSIKMSK